MGGVEILVGADLVWGRGAQAPFTPGTPWNEKERESKSKEGRKEGGWRKEKGDEPHPQAQIVDPRLNIGGAMKLCFLREFADK